MTPQELEQLFEQRFQNELALANQQPAQAPQSQPGTPQLPDQEAVFEQRFQNELGQIREREGDFEERSLLTQSIPRQVKLAVRYGGLPVVGGIVGGVAGKSPLAVAGGMALGYGAEMLDKHLLGDTINQWMDKHLGKPETASERLGEAGARTLMGVAGMGKAAEAVQAATAYKSLPNLLAASLTEFLPTQMIAGGAAGVTGEAMHEAGYGDLAQAGGAMAVGAATPAVIGSRFVSWLNSNRKQLYNALKGMFGDDKAIGQLAKDAIHAQMRKSGFQDNEAVLRAVQGADTGMKPFKSDEGIDPASGLEIRRDIPGVKMTVGDAIAAENKFKRPTEQIGGAWIAMMKQLRGAKGAENVIPSAEKANEAALRDWIKAGDKTLEQALLKPGLEQAARRHGGPVRPINWKPVLDSITSGMRSKEGSPPLGVKVFSEVRKQLMRSRNPDGSVDVEKLYKLRVSINDIIKQHHGLAGNKNKLMEELAKVKGAIDDVLDPEGALGLRSYHKYRDNLLKRRERMEAVQEERGKIEAIVEPRSAEELARADLPIIPTLLHRPTMALNFALKWIAKDIKDPVSKKIAEALADPEKFAEIMRRAPKAPARMKADEILWRAGVLANIAMQEAEENRE